MKCDEEEVSAALKSLNWNRRYKITALRAVLLDVVERTLQGLDVKYKTGTLRTYERDHNSITHSGIT